MLGKYFTGAFVAIRRYRGNIFFPRGWRTTSWNVIDLFAQVNRPRWCPGIATTDSSPIGPRRRAAAWHAARSLYRTWAGTTFTRCWPATPRITIGRFRYRRRFAWTCIVSIQCDTNKNSFSWLARPRPSMNMRDSRRRARFIDVFNLRDIW